MGWPSRWQQSSARTHARHGASQFFFMSRWVVVTQVVLDPWFVYFGFSFFIRVFFCLQFVPGGLFRVYIPKGNLCLGNWPLLTRIKSKRPSLTASC